MTSERTSRFGLTLCAASLSAVLLYSVLRLVAALRHPDPNPALVIWSEHAGFFWRAWTSVYLATMIGFCVWIVAEKHQPRVARMLAASVVPVTSLLVLQSVFVP